MMGVYRNQPLINWINDNPTVVPRFEAFILKSPLYSEFYIVNILGHWLMRILVKRDLS